MVRRELSADRGSEARDRGKWGGASGAYRRKRWVSVGGRRGGRVRVNSRQHVQPRKSDLGGQCSRRKQAIVVRRRGSVDANRSTLLSRWDRRPRDRGARDEGGPEDFRDIERSPPPARHASKNERKGSPTSPATFSNSPDADSPRQIPSG